MELKEPAFKTRRERNQVFEKICDYVNQCETEQSLIITWQEHKDEIEKIKLDDEQSVGMFGEIKQYDELVKVFKNRKQQLLKEENLYA